MNYQRNTVNLKKSGFTMAEMVIAIGLLAVIATVTLPLVFHTINSKKKRVFNETLGALGTVLHEGCMKKEITASNYTQYFMSHINATKHCPINAQAQGCWPGGAQSDPDNTPSAPGMILSNGAYLTGMAYNAATYPFGDNMYIDWNGPASPNQIGDDRMKIGIHWKTEAGYTGGSVSCATGLTKGQFNGPMPPAALRRNKALCDWLLN